MNKISLTILSFCISLSCFAEDTYKTRFNAFTGKQDFVNKTIDSSNSSVDTTNFTNNLSSADATVQKALDTIDDISISSSQWSGIAGSIIYYNSANVGIGTSAPSEKLQVSDGYIKGNLQVNVGIGTTAPAQSLQVVGRIRANDFISDQTATFSYNGDGTVNTITKGTRTITISYNGNGTINTIGDGVLTSTFSYNGDGTVAAITKA